MKDTFESVPLLGGVIIAIAMLAACGDSADRQSGPLLEELTQAEREYALAVPLYNDFMAECMKSEGFEFRDPADSLEPSESLQSIGPSFGVAALVPEPDGSDIDGYGYASAHLERMMSIDEAMRAEDDAVSPDYIEAYSGRFDDASDGGCLGKAFDEFPGFVRLTELGSSLDSHRSEIIASVDASPEFASWRDCMKTMGYGFTSASDPIEALADALDRGLDSGGIKFDELRSEGSKVIAAPGSASDTFLKSVYETEREIAGADYGCDEGSKLRKQALKIFDEIGRHIDAEHS